MKNWIKRVILLPTSLVNSVVLKMYGAESGKACVINGLLRLYDSKTDSGGFRMMKNLIVDLAMPLFRLRWRISRKVKFESGSVVYPSCVFEGGNRICRNTYMSRSYMGFGSYTSKNCSIISTRIGRYTSIGPNVRTTSGSHPIDMVSMHPAFYSTRGQAGFTYVSTQKFNEKLDREYHTIIGNDVWIGDSAILMEGVKVGDGAVVAAGAVVTKDVPPYTIVAGVPAKAVRRRFPEQDIEKLLQIRWWERDQAWISEHAEEFEDVSKFITAHSSDGKRE